MWQTLSLHINSYVHDYLSAMFQIHIGIWSLSETKISLQSQNLNQLNIDRLYRSIWNVETFMRRRKLFDITLSWQCLSFRLLTKILLNDFKKENAEYIHASMSQLQVKENLLIFIFLDMQTCSRKISTFVSCKTNYVSGFCYVVFLVSSLDIIQRKL